MPAAGSSPLARGTRRADPGVRIQQRFIPARAGNTFARETRPSRLLPHPSPAHLCYGIHTGRVRVRRKPYVKPDVLSRASAPRGGYGPPDPPHFFGSSPLARGTRVAEQAHAPSDRFIPARAGNTARLRGTATGRTVHPRSRGEHPIITPRSMLPAGSSPLARGTRLGAERPRHRRRFIPARAGNTTGPGPRGGCRPVHPRSRGEHHDELVFTCPNVGSSPLARGTQRLQGGVGVGHRFIPARAGNTTRSCGTRSSLAVHPRSRGEHFQWLPESEASCGSSPLARGTRPADTTRRETDRFIPARAGNTEPSP